MFQMKANKLASDHTLLSGSTKASEKAKFNPKMAALTPSRATLKAGNDSYPGARISTISHGSEVKVARVSLVPGSGKVAQPSPGTVRKSTSLAKYGQAKARASQYEKKFINFKQIQGMEAQAR